MVKDYPRFLCKGFTPFDPIALARRTEAIVSRGEARKYTAFYCAGVYGGISTRHQPPHLTPATPNPKGPE